MISNAHKPTGHLSESRVSGRQTILQHPFVMFSTLSKFCREHESSSEGAKSHPEREEVVCRGQSAHASTTICTHYITQIHEGIPAGELRAESAAEFRLKEAAVAATRDKLALRLSMRLPPCPVFGRSQIGA
jgi:hypothetical protein